VRPGPIAAWLVGFAAYHWLHNPPLGPEWWVKIVERTSQPDWSYGASLPSFAIAFVLGAAAAFVERRARTVSAPT
jgi:hypothetical protein